MTHGRFVGVIATAFVVGLCGVFPAKAVIVPHHSAAQRHGGWMARDANPKHAWLYVGGYNNNVILIYDLAKFGTPEIGQISNGLNNPGGMTLDSSGTLYVANQRGGNITIYPAGATSPSLTLSQGLSQPVDVAVDTNGDVYVSNRANTPDIVIYPPGETVPSNTIMSNLIQIPTAVLFDATRNLYLADNVSGVSQLPFGSQQFISLGLQGITDASGLALDALNANLFVSGANGNTLVFALGDSKPRRRLKGIANDDYLAIGTVGKHEYLFTPNSANNTVSVYLHTKNSPLTVLNTAANYLVGIAFKPAGVP
jgi:DNA-binding beta-propeller fold protein YncE